MAVRNAGESLHGGNSRSVDWKRGEGSTHWRWDTKMTKMAKGLGLFMDYEHGASERWPVS